MRGNTIIEALGIYLPETIVSTRDVIAGCSRPVVLPLEHITGIKTRRVSGPDEFSIDLAKNAVVNCLAMSKYAPEDIGLLICCNICRYDGPNHRVSFEPNTSIRLRKHFGFDNALVFDITNACAGMFTAVTIVDTFINMGLIRCGMVVSGEAIFYITRTAQQEIEGAMDPRLACLTLGDSGAAIILEQSPSDQLGFHDIDLYTLPRFAGYCIAKATDKEHGGAIMLTDAIRTTAVGIRHGAMHSLHMLQRAGWSPERCHHLIMHQTSDRSLKEGARHVNKLLGKMVCHDGNMINNLAERGNTATTSHFVAVMDNIVNQRIESGDSAVFGITGSGMTIGTALYTFDDLPDRVRRPPSMEEKARRAPSARLSVPTPATRRRRVRIESFGIIPEGWRDERGSTGLAKIAAEKCLEQSSRARNEIDLLIHAGVYRDEFAMEPAIATMIAGELGICDGVDLLGEPKTFAFDVFNGAIGLLNACHVAIQMIGAKRHRHVMVVASEIENNRKVLPSSLRGVRETASALILDESPDEGTGFGDFVFRYDTRHIDAFLSYTGLEHGRPYLNFIEDPLLHDFYLDCIPDAVNELLEIEGLDLSQIRAIFPPQISSAFILRVSERLKLDAERFVDAADTGEDLFSSSLPYSFWRARQKGVVRRGDIGLIINVGTGIQVGCTVYYF